MSDLKETTVLAGSVDPNLAESRLVARIIPHSLYNKETKDFDFALLKLESPLDASDTIKTIALPKSDANHDYGEPCSLAGLSISIFPLVIMTLCLLFILYFCRKCGRK